MPIEKGKVSIDTNNIFPIIKKWLYSDKDIFLRELVSNASDAISKLKTLVGMGNYTLEENEKFSIKVVSSKKKKIIKIIDNGIGMTSEEVMKYINQIAFSGAKDFLEKYKENDESSQIIGHFGLGFYSAFMVAEKVEINTLSWEEGAKAVKWTSDGGTEYELDDSDKVTRGTEITLYLSKEEKEFAEESKVMEILNKYCSFMQYEIFYEDEDAKKDEEKEIKPINDSNPLWLKKPKDCTDEEYKEFYKKAFMDYNEPLFWIHLNMDYPFRLKGILYFPRISNDLDTYEGRIKLFYNQVFVADNIKEVIPEFLMMLKGVIDCPDLPLNVSRSFLQNDAYVSKISSHISKKVADKLKSLFKKERENYNKYWDDINPFVKFGCVKQDKFYDKLKEVLIYKTIEGEYLTLPEYLEKVKETNENKVYYVSDEVQQAQYVKIFKEHDMEAIVLTHIIDNHFMQFLETKEEGVKFLRVDSDISENLKEADATIENSEEIATLFKEITGNEQLIIKVESLKSKGVSAMLLLSEQSRRMQEMSKMWGMPGMQMPSEETLIINGTSNLINAVAEMMKDEDKKEDAKLIARHIYDLAVISNKKLDKDEMNDFIERSNDLLEKLAK